MYFEKKINDIILPICSQMIINNWNYENKSEEFSKLYTLMTIVSSHILKKLWRRIILEVEKKKIL